MTLKKLVVDILTRIWCVSKLLCSGHHVCLHGTSKGQICCKHNNLPDVGAMKFQLLLWLLLSNINTKETTIVHKMTKLVLRNAMTTPHVGWGAEGEKLNTWVWVWHEINSYFWHANLTEGNVFYQRTVEESVFWNVNLNVFVTQPEFVLFFYFLHT